MFVKFEVTPMLGSVSRVDGTNHTGQIVTLGTLGVDPATGMHNAVASGELHADGFRAGAVRLGAYPFRDEALAAILATVLTPNRPAVPTA